MSTPAQQRIPGITPGLAYKFAEVYGPKAGEEHTETLIQQLIDGLVDTIHDLTGVDLSVISDVVRTVESTISDLISYITGGGILEDVAGVFAGIRSSIQAAVSEVAGVVNNIATWIDNAVQDFIAALVYGLKGVTGGLVDLTGWLKNTRDDAEDAVIEVGNQGEIIKGIDYRKANTVDVPNNIPMWQTLNPLEDPSFPRSQILAQNSPGYFPASGRAELAFIRAPRTRVYNTVGVILDNSMSSAAPIEIAVYKVTDTGDLERQWSSGNIASLLTGAVVDARFDIDTEIIAEGGDYFAVAILQSGGNLRGIMGVEAVALAVPQATFPPKINALNTSGGGTPATIGRSALDFSQNWMPWACLGRKPDDGPPQEMDYADNFDRGDSGDLGPNWASRGDLGIRNQRATTTQETNGQRTALWVYPLNYDDHSIEATFGSPSQGNYTILLLRGNNTFTAGIGIAANIWDFKMVRCTGVNEFQTIGGTFGPGLSNGDHVRLETKGNRYRVWRNGGLIHETTISTPTGPAYRFAGTSMYRALWSSSPEIQNWRARDLDQPPPIAGGGHTATIVKAGNQGLEANMLHTITGWVAATTPVGQVTEQGWVAPQAGEVSVKAHVECSIPTFALQAQVGRLRRGDDNLGQTVTERDKAQVSTALEVFTVEAGDLIHLFAGATGGTTTVLKWQRSGDTATGTVLEISYRPDEPLPTTSAWPGPNRYPSPDDYPTED